MRATFGIDELRIKSSPLAGILHTALEDISRAELAADLAGVDQSLLIGERSVARDGENAGTTREICRKGFGDAVDEGIVLRAAADVKKGQDYNGKSRRVACAGFGRSRRRLVARGSPTLQSAPPQTAAQVGFAHSGGSPITSVPSARAVLR